MRLPWVRLPLLLPADDDGGEAEVFAAVLVEYVLCLRVMLVLQLSLPLPFLVALVEYDSVMEVRRPEAFFRVVWPRL